VPRSLVLTIHEELPKKIAIYETFDIRSPSCNILGTILGITLCDKKKVNSRKLRETVASKTSSIIRVDVVFIVDFEKVVFLLYLC